MWPMRSIQGCLVLATAVFCLAAACSPRPQPGPAYNTTATVKDIMDSVVDPNADGIWDSTEIIATLDGVTEKSPKTDDDWKMLRRHAIALMEASNMLLIPGRQVAQPGEKAEDERVDLHPEEIQALIDKDRAAWEQLAAGLHAAASKNLAAITAKDVKQLIDAGETLDTACESCHKKYWYRDDPVLYGADPRKLPTEGSQPK